MNLKMFRYSVSVFLLSTAIFVFNGCFPKRDISAMMNSWKGEHISKVIASWGPPNNVTSDYAGGQIFTWSEQEIKRHIPRKRTTPKTETKGEFGYNPLTGKYEWKETTRPTGGVPTVPALTNEILRERYNSRPPRTETRMLYTNADGIVYHWRYSRK